MHLDYNQTKEIINNSKVLYTQSELELKINKIARQIELDIEGEVPVFLNVMNGGMFFAVGLLQQLKSAFILDYIHASRYGDATYGANHITWYKTPKAELIQNRDVYIIDDILDEGHTLAEIKRFIMDVGARSCKIIVLVDKDIGKEKPIKADYVGLTAPNHFLFGYGMDIYGLYRQLPEIYIYSLE
jgi:hypoxanthine phosphoribosyltransferase